MPLYLALELQNLVIEFLFSFLCDFSLLHQLLHGFLYAAAESEQLSDPVEGLELSSLLAKLVLQSGDDICL